MRAAVLAAALAELIRAAQQPKVADYSCLFSLSPPHLHPVYSGFFFSCCKWDYSADAELPGKVGRDAQLKISGIRASTLQTGTGVGLKLTLSGSAD